MPGKLDGDPVWNHSDDCTWSNPCAACEREDTARGYLPPSYWKYAAPPPRKLLDALCDALWPFLGAAAAAFAIGMLVYLGGAW